MPATSSSRSDRPSLAHSHRSAPEMPSRSTIFQPDPPQSGQTSSAMNPIILLDGRQNSARHHRLAFAHSNRNHGAAAPGLHFVLHLHGFHYQDALAGCDTLAGLYQHSDDLARHGSDDVFPILTWHSGARSRPAAWIADGHTKTRPANRDPDAILARLGA